MGKSAGNSRGNSINQTEYSFKFDYQGLVGQALVGMQMLLVAFTALVLVPILTGLDTNVALFTAGLGTLIFQFITRGQVPIFLGSSFAFIAPIMYSTQTWGAPATMGGLASAGLFYIALSFAIRSFGVGWLRRVFPPVVIGPVIMVIGLSVAPFAIELASGVSEGERVVSKGLALALACITLVTTLLMTILGTGLLRGVSVIIGVVVGYVVSLILGLVLGIDLVNFDAVSSASWFAVPPFVRPEFHWEAIFFILPVAIAPAIEHCGDIFAIGAVTKKDYVSEPGLDRTMVGDGVATTISGVLGGPPNTTYSEVVGVVMLTKVFNPAVMTWAAFFAIAMAFVGKLSGVLGSIPAPVIGGVMILMFGLITTVGVTVITKAKTDMAEPRNMVIAAIILVVGIGNLVVPLGGGVVLGGIGLASILGVVLNLVLPSASK